VTNLIRSHPTNLVLTLALVYAVFGFLSHPGRGMLLRWRRTPPAQVDGSHLKFISPYSEFSSCYFSGNVDTHGKKPWTTSFFSPCDIDWRTNQKLRSAAEVEKRSGICKWKWVIVHIHILIDVNGAFNKQKLWQNWN